MRSRSTRIGRAVRGYIIFVSVLDSLSLRGQLGRSYISSPYFSPSFFFPHLVTRHKKAERQKTGTGGRRSD